MNTPTPFHSGPARLAYYDSGPRTARPLVVIAGGPGFDCSYMRVGDAFERLADSQRVVFYDQRGTGAASAFEPQFTNDDYVDDIEALRVALGVDCIDLLGHSYGGYLAMAYAVKYPARAGRLVLVNSLPPKRSPTFIFPEVFPERLAEYQAWRSAIARRDVETARQKAHVHISMLFCDPAVHDAWTAQAAHVNFNPLVAAALWADPTGPDLTDAIRELRVRTLVVTGRYDMNIPVRVGFELSNAIPGAQLHVFERSNHVPFYEEPEAFVRAMRGFLQI